MPAQLGISTKNTFYKSPAAIFSQEFQQDGLSYTITLGGALIASNVLSGYVGGTLVSVTYATSSTATIAALAVAIAAVPGVKSATVTSTYVITVIPNDQTIGIALLSWAVTLGSSQVTTVVAAVDHRIKAGMPVMLLANGNIAPCDPTNIQLECIGYAMDRERNLPDGTPYPILPAEITVALKGYAIISMEADSAGVVPGGVEMAAYDYTTDNNVCSQVSVTASTIIGWSMDTATVGQIARVIIRN